MVVCACRPCGDIGRLHEIDRSGGWGSRTVVREPLLFMGRSCMGREPPHMRPNAAGEAALQAYLLGSVPFEAVLAFQRRLVYDVAGNRSQGALVLCEHPPLITVGAVACHVIDQAP